MFLFIQHLAFKRAVRIATIGIALYIATDCRAEITTDGSLGPAVNLTGPSFRIGHDLGATAGQNLFHSFLNFNLHAGESAIFSGPNTIHNVISRVTGGNPSAIDGLLRSEVGSADFYFINPAGVMFGPNARVDVPACFHAGTGNEMRFADHSVFSASNPMASTLSATDPEAFGYLGSGAGNLLINGSRLEFRPGAGVTLSGREILILGNGIEPATVKVPGGKLQIVANGDLSQSVPFSEELTPGGGYLQISNAGIQTSGAGGGQLNISAGNAAFADALIASDNTGTAPATSSLNIQATGTIEIKDTRIQSNTTGSGESGGIWLKAGKLKLIQEEPDRFSGLLSQAGEETAGSCGGIEVTLGDSLALSGTVGIISSTLGDANAGAVSIQAAGAVTAVNGGIIASTTSGTGRAGNVHIDAGNLQVDGAGTSRFTGVASQAYPDGSGNSGDVTLAISGLLEVLNGGRISSSTFSSGDAGIVRIQAENVRIDGMGSRFTGIASSNDYNTVGDAGKVIMTVSGHLEVLNGGEISSGTFGAGNAGNITINSTTLSIDGKGADKSTGISSQANSRSSGHAGTVEITVDGLLEVADGGSVTSNTFSSGNAGSVSISADNLRIDGHGSDRFTGISSSAQPSALGQAGTLRLTVADLLEILNGGDISSSSYGPGRAGGIRIEAGNLRIDGQDAMTFTGISSRAEYGSTGKGGTIQVTVSDFLELLRLGAVSSSTFGRGDSGDVEITAGRIRIDGMGFAAGVIDSAEPFSQGNAGRLTVRATGLLEVLNGGLISSSTFGYGDAGDVLIQAGELILDGQTGLNPTYIASASREFAQGFSGDLTVQTGKLTVRNSGLISISTDQILPDATSSRSGNALLAIQSSNVRLDQDAQISAQSWGNVPAAAIEITAENLTLSGNSSITTSSIEADGGPIILQGEILELRNSLVTSSVMGGNGDGGNITLKGRSDAATALILENGFIQANAPAGARGGDIFIDVKALIPEGGSLKVGGQLRQTFHPDGKENIIQAAAPGGEQGIIQITSPELDISGSLITLDTGLFKPIHLEDNACRTFGDASGNSLVSTGVDGVDPQPDRHSALRFTPDRLEKIFMMSAEPNK